MFDFIAGTALILAAFAVIGLLAKIFWPTIIRHIED